MRGYNKTPDGLIGCREAADGAYRPRCRECDLGIQYEYEKTEKRKSLRMDYRKRYNDSNRHKMRAHQLVSEAIGDGVLARPSECERCHDSKHVVGHHEDYSRPLDVAWLCEPCHKAVHAIKAGSVNY